MSKLTAPHLYIVKGTLKNDIFPSHGWLFFSYKPLEEFCELVPELAPEYNLEVIEEHLPDMTILSHWDIN